MSGAFELGGLSITTNRLWIIVLAALVFVGLQLVLRATPFGLQMRAVTQNRRMAAAMGISTAKIDMLAFGLGSGVAGIAGVALSQIDNVSPNLGQGYIIDSFMVVVFGGVGNLWGTALGALALGIANKFLEPLIGAVQGQIVLLVFIILFIQKRPRGLVRAQGPRGGSMNARLDRLGVVFAATLLLIAILVPALSLSTPPTSVFHIPPYVVQLLGKYLCYAILAVALDLVWGYCGILSLGHGAFFALGGYAMGMYLMRQIGARGVYANPILPDFMVFLNWKELPVAWWGFHFFPYAMLMVVLAPGLLALGFGWFAFRSRVTGVYLSIITQAMTFALFKEFFRNDFGFGGNNGLTDFKDLLGFSLQSASTKAALFSASAVALVSSYAVARAIVASKYGKALTAVRDAESRMRFLGYRVENFKLFAFVVSAIMAGVAGALYVPQVGIINPGEFAPANSIEAAIWVAVGGRGLSSAPRSAPSPSTSPRPISPAPFPNTGSMAWARCSSSSPCFCPRVCSVSPSSRGRETARALRRRRRRGRTRERFGQTSQRFWRSEPDPDAAVSRRRQRLLRRLQGSARPVAGAGARRDARRSSVRTGPERRR